MPRLIFISLILLGVALFIVRVIMKFNAGISGTRSAVKNDFKQLAALLDAYELAPWHYKEIDLISRNHDVTSQHQMHARMEHGQFYSIYEEPILAFAVKEYTENNRRIGGVKLNNKKYLFNVFEDQVELFHEDQALGQISIKNGVSLEHKGSKVHIDAYSGTGLIPLSVNDEHCISIAAEDEFVGVAGRMLHKLKDLDQDENELVLISVAFALANKQI